MVPFPDLPKSHFQSHSLGTVGLPALAIQGPSHLQGAHGIVHRILKTERGRPAIQSLAGESRRQGSLKGCHGRE